MCIEFHVGVHVDATIVRSFGLRTSPPPQRDARTRIALCGVCRGRVVSHRPIESGTRTWGWAHEHVHSYTLQFIPPRGTHTESARAAALPTVRSA